MKKLNAILIIVLSSIFSGSLLASIQVNFDYKTFLIPNEGPYVETHLNFIGGTMKYARNTNGLLQANIEALIIFRNSERIVAYEKINLTSPETMDSLFVDFLDIRRFTLASGSYFLELSITDLNLENSTPLMYEEIVEIPAYNLLTISDIILISGWGPTEESNDLSRSGYDVLPRVSSVYSGDDNQLAFYTEAYHTDKFFSDGKEFIISTSIENAYFTKVIEESVNYKKFSPNSVIPLIQTKRINELQEGVYNLTIEIRDRENVVQSSKTLEFIKTSGNNTNSSTGENKEVLDEFSVYVDQLKDEDQLYAHLLSLEPIADVYDLRTIRSTISNDRSDDDLEVIKTEKTSNENIQLQIESNAKLKNMQNFLYKFWVEKSPEGPLQSWLEYLSRVEAVDAEFGNRLKKGFETDRGRIYLEYGSPNTRVIRKHDTGANPYEIWHFYQAKEFANKRFVFMDTDQVLNDYRLIQSDMIGEVRNDNWIDMILSGVQTNRVNNQGQGALDKTTFSDGARNIIKDLYLNPR
tara:strand:+ start:8354 stop:9922 length:1569 start_codon:yes stop_codon:yes gene_type:complete